MQPKTPCLHRLGSENGKSAATAAFSILQQHDLKPQNFASQSCALRAIYKKVQLCYVEINREINKKYWIRRSVKKRTLIGAYLSMTADTFSFSSPSISVNAWIYSVMTPLFLTHHLPNITLITDSPTADSFLSYFVLFVNVI